MYDSVSDDGVPGKSGRAPPWTPSGGDPHFDAWLRRWMRDNGHVHLPDTLHCISTHGLLRGGHLILKDRVWPSEVCIDCVAPWSRLLGLYLPCGPLG